MLACLLGASVDLARKVSPYVEQISSNEVLVELSSSWRKEVRCMEEALPEDLQIGVGTVRLVAGLAARSAERVQIVAPGKEAAFLAPLPVTLLPLEEETIRRLHLLGLVTMKEVAKLSKSDLFLQFGMEGLRLFDWVRGIDAHPLQLQREEEPIEESVDFESGATLLKPHIQQALERLLQRVQAEGSLCRVLVITFRLAGADPASVTVRFSRAPRNAQAAVRLLQTRLEQVSLPAPIEGFCIEVAERSPAAYSQLELFSSCFEEKKRRLLHHMTGKTKPALLMQLVWDDPASRLPERRAHLQSLVRPHVVRSLLQPKPCHVHASSSLQPEAVCTGGQVRAIRSLLKVWDIDEEWWSSQPIHRTYYELVLGGGQLQRLFYDRLQGRWFSQ